jgi:ribonucleoside-diphosphate reductase beta chain
MGELMGLATKTVAETFRKFDNKPPFGLVPDEMTAYAMDKLSRRLGAIESARGADLLTIDRDASPEGAGGEVPLGGPARS